MTTTNPGAPPASIAVFRALQLGDMLCAVPALRALRAWAPQSRITLIGLPWAKELAQRFPHYIDDFLAFPGFPGFPEREAAIEQLFGFLHDARRREFDLALQLHGSGRFSNPLVRLLLAKRHAGFGARDERDDQGFIRIAWPEEGPEIVRLLTLIEALGASARGTELELPLTREDWNACDALAARSGLDRRRPYVCVHPGARLQSRRWPLERSAQLGRALAGDGWRVVVTGSAEESEMAAALVAKIGADAVSVAGATTLGSLAALISRSALLACNDTGVSHVAAAVRAPSIVIASGSDVWRWAPLDRDRHRVFAHSVPCRPCAHDVCPVPGHPCAHGVGVDEVVAGARAMLERTLRRAA